MSEFILLGDPETAAARPFAKLHARTVRSSDEALDAFRRFWRRAVWIAPRASALRLLSGLAGRPTGDQRLLLLDAPPDARHGLLHALFRFVVAPAEGVQLLATDEVAEILGSETKEDLFIGGAADRDEKSVVLYRGDLEPLIVPLPWFKARPKGPKPDASKLEVTDFGQTVRLGDYEAATDAILYEFDATYRQRAKARRLDEDRSLGGALRRLRLQQGLGRGDFPGITSKEVARIERGEVKKPHAVTLATMAKRLGVEPDELATY